MTSNYETIVDDSWSYRFCEECNKGTLQRIFRNEKNGEIEKYQCYSCMNVEVLLRSIGIKDIVTQIMDASK